MKNAVSVQQFPMLSAVFSKPSVLEAGLPVDALGGVIPVRDPSRFGDLKGRKAAKTAKFWAPLVVHNLLNGAHGSELDEGTIEVLQQAEYALAKHGTGSWATAFREAGEKGVAPSSHIRALDKSRKVALNLEKKAWKETAKKVEGILVGWMVGSKDQLQSTYEGLEQGDHVTSLKRLSKFSFKA